MTRVLVTGATGFIGRPLCERLAAAGYVVRAALRRPQAIPAGVAESCVIGDLGASTEWAQALQDVDAVVHAAARTHVLRDTDQEADRYWETNWRATERLAAEAARRGVSRFVFLSSVKVYGPQRGQPFGPRDVPRPEDAYGRSKLLAEEALRRVAADSGMQARVVRLPLTYGPGVGANFLRLLRAVDRELWLPFGAISNRRSLVNLWNVCDLLEHLLRHPAAPSEPAWLVTDGEDISTPELIRAIAAAMNRRPRLLRVPVGALRLAGAALGKGPEIRRLCDSLCMDSSETRLQLHWEPPVRLRDALTRTVTWYRASEDRNR